MTRMTRADVPLVVRHAVPADAAAIARVHIRAWQEAYAPLVPLGALDDLSDDQEPRAARWATIIDDDVTEVRVAERDGVVVGWSSASAGRGDSPPRDLELEGLYVLAAEYGRGAGQALLDATLGDRPAFLWMAARNARAHAFYLRNGFLPDGARDEHPLHGHPVAIARYVR